MFPLKDENPTYSTPFVTLGLISLNLLVWVLVQGMGRDPALQDSVCRLGFIPGYLFGGIPTGTEVSLGYGVSCVLGGFPAWGTIISSMFLHGGWLHLLGNLWFLWVFGNNIEDSTGHGRFLLFYLLCGTVAALTQAASDPQSAIPMVGASGAISGVMGGYIVLYPKVRVHMLIFLGIIITRIVVPAVVVLGFWFLLQLLSGIPRVAAESGGVAFLAHAGGFIAGALLVLLFRDRRLVERRLAHGLP